MSIEAPIPAPERETEAVMPLVAEAPNVISTPVVVVDVASMEAEAVEAARQAAILRDEKRRAETPYGTTGLIMGPRFIKRVNPNRGPNHY